MGLDLKMGGHTFWELPEGGVLFLNVKRGVKLFEMVILVWNRFSEWFSGKKGGRLFLNAAKEGQTFLELYFSNKFTPGKCPRVKSYILYIALWTSNHECPIPGSMESQMAIPNLLELDQSRNFDGRKSPPSMRAANFPSPKYLHSNIPSLNFIYVVKHLIIGGMVIQWGNSFESCRRHLKLF